ncbi:response regulator [Bacillus salipaludis]|uniref:Response regulator n=1 Tax=Bacillus salipaludis TaxID=2547811 RepID=A0A4R5VN91_9BACI|nr:response regulator [Bacillus salipaludis]MDQ6598156.1 response regulator [Bacillus salipaludis]TDK59458.1 response regulator [Bacillus salipaludis]
MRKMLIVDDDWLISSSLMAMDEWNERNIDVIGTAENGTEALYWLENEKIDMILTDIRMPNMDGLELTKHIYENSPRIQVIIMSGYEEFTYAHNALKYNARGYILKPIDTDELFEVIDKIQKETEIKSQDSPLNEEKSASYHERLVLSAKSYINANYMKTISLKDVAKRVHLTEHYFGQIFKATTNESFNQFLTRVRMEKACHLLKNPNLKYYQISQQVGYTDPKYFTKMFQKSYGSTPREYRNRIFHS